MLVALIAVMVIGAMASAMLLSGSSRDAERGTSLEGDKALYIAEAGMSQTVAAVSNDVLAGFGTEDAPIAFGGGAYWTTVVDDGAGTATITSWGRYGQAERATQVIMERDGSGIYDYAVYAGNGNGDPGFDLVFDGTGGMADDLQGRVYSGGNVVLSGNARIHGTVEALGSVSGSFSPSDPPRTGVVVPVPDVASMDFEHNHDFDVAAMFEAATLRANALGGLAWQLPESSPAHIFRKDPSDRLLNTIGTVKDDYFLEDPYEPVSTSMSTSAGTGTKISLSGLGGEPGPVSTDKLYYIDGNLWVHNWSVNSFTFSNTGSEQIQVTFVVKGNVYFTDNLIYQGSRQDGVAFIAMRDAGVPDSGNVYLGNSTMGTLERLDAFMYAENCVYLNNAAPHAPTNLVVNGNVTAGNLVRTPGGAVGARSKLSINHDNRIANSDITLPGIAGLHFSSMSWELRVWQEIAPRP